MRHDDPDDLPVFAGWLIASNGFAIYEKRGSAYEMRENHAKVSCYPPPLPFADAAFPPVVKVGCRRVPRRFPEESSAGQPLDRQDAVTPEIASSDSR